jgi:3',5'-cyclic-AMP phosphodiesterase
VLIAQISDLHVTAPGSRGLVDAVATLRNAIGVLNTMRPRPDCVIATGDLVNDGTDAEYRVLFGVLAELEVPLLLLPGNHDDARLLRMHMQMQGLLRADEPGHLGTVIDHHAVRIVLVDTTDPARHDGVFPAGRAAWLDGVLGAEPDRPTVVAMHHPPFTTGIWWMDAMGIEAEDRARFERVIRAHPNVRLVLAGHLHRAVCASWGSTVLSVCPSTVHQVGLSLDPAEAPQITFEAPSLQLHRWTGDGFVSHTRPLDVNVAVSLASDRSDWEPIAQRLARGGPFPKGEKLF